MAAMQVERFTSAAGTAQTTDYDDVRHQIERWPSVERARLAQYIITTLVSDEPAHPKKRNAVEQIVGRMAIAGVPAPSDEDVAHMLEESRLERYS